MRNRILLSFLLVIGLLLSGGYALTAQAAGMVTNCSTFGSTATPGVYIAGTLGAALVGGGVVTFQCSNIIVVPQIDINADTTIDATGYNVTLSGGQNNRVFFVSSVPLKVINLKVTKGSALDYSGGGIFSYGTVTLFKSTVSGNSALYYGGGIYNSGGTLNITDSTIDGNQSSYGGGGIFSFGGTPTVTLTNSTVANNSDGSFGGGIFNSGTLNITNSTIDGNQSSYGGGGIFSFGTYTVTLTNTIVANNTSNCFGTIIDNGYNLDSGISCGFTPPTTSLSGKDPKLGDLKDNGGPTQTQALLAGSPAIDQIPPGTNDCGTTVINDQRGVARPQGSACDIGAYEYESCETTITGLTATPSVLWPPNHRMMPVTVVVHTETTCNQGPTCKITSVTSNEPENGTGDGNTAPDWQITGDLDVNLRAERAGTGTGRVYTIAIQCTDAAGNSSTKNVTVSVPHNQ